MNILLLFSKYIEEYIMPQNIYNDMPRMLTTDMAKGIESIFDAAEPPSTEQMTQLQNLQAASIQSNTENNAIVSGGVTNIAAAQNMMWRQQRQIVRDYKINRNDPCPCGSGKKYKNCCLKTGKYEGTHEL